MELSTKKWIEDGQFMVEIRGALTSEEQDLIDKYGDMRVDLSACKSRKSYSKLSEFLASGCFTNKEDAFTFAQNIGEKLRKILDKYRELTGDFEGTEVHNIEGLEMLVSRNLRHNNFHLHITTKPSSKIRELIEKYGDQDIDISTDKFTGHVQALSPQLPKMLSLRIDKTFENAVDARDYENKIVSQLNEIMKVYADKKDDFSGMEKTEI